MWFLDSIQAGAGYVARGFEAAGRTVAAVAKRTAKAVAAHPLVAGALSLAGFAGVSQAQTSALPTALQPAAMVTNAMTEVAGWLIVVIPILIALYMLSRL